MWSLAKNSQWCTQQGKPSTSVRIQDTERMGSLGCMFILIPVHSSLLQVMLVSECSTLPRSFLRHHTWVSLHFDLIGQFKDSQICSTVLNQLKWLLISGYLKMLFFWPHTARSNWIRNLNGVCSKLAIGPMCPDKLYLQSVNIYLINQG